MFTIVFASIVGAFLLFLIVGKIIADNADATAYREQQALKQFERESLSVGGTD